MTNKHRRLAAIVLGSLAIAGAINALGPRTVTAAEEVRYIVKLYEHGKVVGQWESNSEPKSSDQGLVFTIRRGMTSRGVRIHGTYSAEQK